MAEKAEYSSEWIYYTTALLTDRYPHALCSSTLSSTLVGPNFSKDETKCRDSGQKFLYFSFKHYDYKSTLLVYYFSVKLFFVCDILDACFVLPLSLL
jgi:hypothetical protein